jgi:hypothetical protein
MVGLELEVMAKKLDRFGWDRDRGSAVHDRLVTDWMDALQDYPLDEVKAACVAWVQDNPRRMANEGDIRGKILAARATRIAGLPKPPPEPARARPTPEQAKAIIEAAGFRVRRMGDSPDA